MAWAANLTKFKIRKMRDIWSRVPEVHCKGLCGDTVCTNVPLMPVEHRFLSERYGAVHHIQIVRHLDETTGAVVVAPTLGVSTDPDHAGCPFYRQNRCSIYEDRPLMCRIYGHPVGELAGCPHGCRVERPMRRGRVRELCELLLQVVGAN